MARSQRATLAAATDLLLERGFAGLTIERVAARARVAKTTIYRHWPNRGALAVSVCAGLVVPAPVPDTGDPRADLVSLVGGPAEGLAAAPWAKALASLIDVAQRDPELARLHAAFIAQRASAAATVLRRAVAAGQLPADTDVDLAVGLLVGPLFYRRLVSHEPVDAALATEIAARTLASLGAPRSPAT